VKTGRGVAHSVPSPSTLVLLGARTVDMSYARLDAHSIPDLDRRVDRVHSKSNGFTDAFVTTDEREFE